MDFFYNNSTDLAFGIILNKTSNNIMNDQLYQYYINKLTPTKVGLLCFPKFRQESKYKLEGLFKKMGLTDLFINANLSEIVINNNLQCITDIVHHSLIMIDEKGIDTSKSNIVGNINVIVNRPFMYYIRYKPYNNIIFMGEYI